MSLICTAFALSASIVFSGVSAQAQSAPANATIGNQASATYTDGSNTTRTATSNTVVTTVQQVAALTLTADNSKVTNPGAPVYYPHTVTNTGNGNDSYSLSATNNAAGDNFDLTGLAVFADTDGNGVPDSATPITVSPTLAPGESFRFVVSGTVPATATSTQTSAVTVRATSVTTPAATLTNTDTVTVTNNAAIEVTKSISSNSGPAGSGVTYTLSYRNIGNTTATNFALTDNIPALTNYVAGSARWSKAATPLTDAPAGDPVAADGTTINYAFTAPAAGNRGSVGATISSVAPQSSGSVSFNIAVDAGIAPQIINNQATFTYNDGAANQTGNSNTVPFTVTRNSGVTLGDFTVPTAASGSAVRFNDLLTNTGNAIDTFDITLDNTTNTFPAGTTFKFFKADGATPLVDTNGNGIPDSGAIAPGGTTTIVLIAQLPNGTVTGPFTINAVARSVNNPASFDPGTNTVSTITANSVEITNAGGLGAGALTATPVTTLTGAPGTTQRFTLNVQNTSASADSYVVDFSNTAVFSPAAPLPAGYTVTFRDAGGAVLTNTGTVAPGATRQLFADVFIPSNASSGNIDIFFRAFSSTSGATDTKFDRVTVTNVAALTVEPNNFGQVFPGGTIVYPHVVTNNGNSAQTNIALTLLDSATGFTSVAYADLNNDGVLQPNETTTPLTTIASLAPGASVNVLVKVFAPAGVASNTQNVTTLTGTSAGGQTDSATDTTTVVSGDLKIEKFQSVDPDGPAVAQNFGAFTKGNASAAPGAFIRYQIVVTNTGNVAITSVVINDTTPGYTTYATGSASASATPASTATATYSVNGGAPIAATTAPANGASGVFTFNVGSLAPGGSATATFVVRVNP